MWHGAPKDTHALCRICHHHHCLLPRGEHRPPTTGLQLSRHWASLSSCSQEKMRLTTQWRWPLGSSWSKTVVIEDCRDSCRRWLSKMVSDGEKGRWQVNCCSGCLCLLVCRGGFCLLCLSRPVVFGATGRPSSYSSEGQYDPRNPDENTGSSGQPLG